MGEENKYSERLRKLRYAMNQASNEPVCIIVTQIDPDAIGAALGLNLILNVNRKKSQIYYTGTISHDQNINLFKQYNLHSIFKKIEELPENANLFALVDSSTTDDPRLDILKNKIQPQIVIDHHRGSNIAEDENNFVWIEEIGAASTLVTELLIEQRLNLSNGNKYIATCLAIGIYTDTKNLISASERDRQSYEYLCKFYNHEDFCKIINYKLPLIAFNNHLRALKSTIQQGARMVSSMGLISSNRGNDISTVADYLIRLEGFNLVVVWGLMDKKIIRLSARSTADAPFDLNEFLRQRIPTAGAKLAPDGHGEGGGRIEFNISDWLTENEQTEILTSINRKICNLIFKEI